MKKLLVVAAAVSLVACGGAKPKPGGGSSGGGGEDAPSWVKQGSGEFNTEAGKRLQGIGTSGARDPRSRREQADTKAKDQLTREVDALLIVLSKLSENTKDNASEEISAIGRKAAAKASKISDHWVADGTESSLDLLDLKSFKDALASVDGDEKLRKEMGNNADRAFDNMTKQ